MSTIGNAAKALLDDQVRKYPDDQGFKSEFYTRGIYHESARVMLRSLAEPSEKVQEAMSRHAANGMTDWRDLHIAFIEAVLAEPST